MRLLFHCCCAPCAAAPVESLRSEGASVTLFWHNPNIHPSAEYEGRRDSLFAFAALKNLPTEAIDEYGAYAFLREVGGETEAGKRCAVCYRMRLNLTARRAKELGFDAFGASLFTSPYQRHDQMREIAEESARTHGVEFFYRDFRPFFRESQAQARAIGMHMQKYCGCVFSEADRHALKSAKAPAADRPASASQGARSVLRNAVPSSLERLTMLAGAGALEKLRKTRVLVFGVGGVGSWCAEALARSGVGKIDIVDFDTVCASNVNRQLQATTLTLGRVKVEALKERLLEINPSCEVRAWGKAFSREVASEFEIETADYVIDAIDSLAHKLDLIEICCAAGARFFSSMGMARKMDPTRIKVAGIWETRGCPLARVVRQGLRKRGFRGNFTVVYGEECLDNIPVDVIDDSDGADGAGASARAGKKAPNGSVVTVTAAAGMILASLILRDVCRGLI